MQITSPINQTAVVPANAGSLSQPRHSIGTENKPFKLRANYFTIEITKIYKDPQWKDDLKTLIKTAGKN